MFISLIIKPIFWYLQIHLSIVWGWCRLHIKLRTYSHQDLYILISTDFAAKRIPFIKVPFLPLTITGDLQEGCRIFYFFSSGLLSTKYLHRGHISQGWPQPMMKQWWACPGARGWVLNQPHTLTVMEVPRLDGPGNQARRRWPHTGWLEHAGWILQTMLRTPQGRGPPWPWKAGRTQWGYFRQQLKLIFYVHIHTHTYNTQKDNKRKKFWEICCSCDFLQGHRTHLFPKFQRSGFPPQCIWSLNSPVTLGPTPCPKAASRLGPE